MMRAAPISGLRMSGGSRTAGRQKLPTLVVALEIEQGTVKGDDVALRWTSDQAVTLHLHGYDIETKVPARGTAEMRFCARAAGRFPVERHEPGADPHTPKALLYAEAYRR